MFRTVLLAFLWMLAHSSSTHGQILLSEETAPDARALAVGEAFTAIAEGPSAVWWNPGALAFGRSIAIGPFSQRQLAPEFFDDVRIYSAGGTGGIGTLGAGVHFSHVDYGNAFGTPDASEYTLHLGVGVGLGRLIWKHLENFEWGIGGAYKYHSTNLGQIAPNLGIVAGTGWDLDAGTLATLRFPVEITTANGSDRVGLRGGVKWRSVLGRDVKNEAQEQQEPFQQSVTFAVASELVLDETAASSSLLRAIFSMEHEEFIGDFGALPGIQRFGLEIGLGLPPRDPTLFLAPRVGYINDIDSDIRDVAYGAGLGGNVRIRSRQAGARFDYARVPRSEGIASENQYSLWLWWSL